MDEIDDGCMSLEELHALTVQAQGATANRIAVEEVRKLLDAGPKPSKTKEIECVECGVFFPPDELFLGELCPSCYEGQRDEMARAAVERALDGKLG